MSSSRVRPRFDDTIAPLVESIELRFNPHALDKRIQMDQLANVVLDFTCPNIKRQPTQFPALKYLGINVDPNAALSESGQARIRTLVNSILVQSDMAGWWSIDPTKRTRTAVLELVVNLADDQTMQALFGLNTAMKRGDVLHNDFGLNVVCPVEDPNLAIQTIRRLSHMRPGASALVVQLVVNRHFTSEEFDRVISVARESDVDLLIHHD
ncbi:MAG: hypothetical protein ACP5N9_03765 [Candidatus Bilamarchaeum sp.]